MNFLGIGPLELAFIVIIAIIIFGPQDLVKAGKNVGRFLRKVVTSPSWKVFQDTSKEIRDLPTRLIREAGIEDKGNLLVRGFSILHDVLFTH